LRLRKENLQLKASALTKAIAEAYPDYILQGDGSLKAKPKPEKK